MLFNCILSVQIEVKDIDAPHPEEDKVTSVKIAIPIDCKGTSYNYIPFSEVKLKPLTV